MRGARWEGLAFCMGQAERRASLGAMCGSRLVIPHHVTDAIGGVVERAQGVSSRIVAGPVDLGAFQPDICAIFLLTAEGHA